MKTLSEGKTKLIIETLNPNTVLVRSKDDLTAGDGTKHVILAGKARLATTTTCNVFNLLRTNGVLVAYNERKGDDEFTAPKLNMIPIEVVVRRFAHGSYIKRNPGVPKGEKLPDLVVEFYLKTKDKKWKDHDLICDDPLMLIDGEDVKLHDPKIAIAEPFLVLKVKDVLDYPNHLELFERMRARAKQAFVILEEAWLRVAEGRLIDYKVEFGLSTSGTLWLGDVIDNDSWRLEVGGVEYSKQVFRDDGDISVILANYEKVAQWTEQFLSPK